MKYFIAASILFVGLLPGIAKADMIPDNYHTVESCLQIDNLSAYPDYDFVLSGSYRFPYSDKITTGENCDLGGSGTILAIKKTDWDAVKYAPEGSEEAGDWSSNSANSSLFITSGLNLSFATTLPDTDAAVSKKYTVHVDAVTADMIQARLVQTDVTNKNGSTETIPGTSKSTTTTQASTTTSEQPSSATETGSDSSVPVVAIVIAVLGVLGLGLAYRTWKK